MPNDITSAPFNWRDHLKVHPAADLFPLMSEQELKELAADIKQNGLQCPIMIWRKQLIDGRNRLDALAMLGWLSPKRERRHRERHFEYENVLPITVHYPEYSQDGDEDLILPDYNGRCSDSFESHLGITNDDEVYRAVLALNLRRRHLTAEQKRELIAKLLKLQPETSDRQIGKTVKADNKTVAAVRSDMERREEIPHVETRTDSKGRKQPSNKPERKSRKLPAKPSRSAEEICADINDATKGITDSGIEFARMVGALALSVTDEFLDDAAARDDLRAEIRWAADEWTKLADKLDKIALTHSTSNAEAA